MFTLKFNLKIPKLLKIMPFLWQKSSSWAIFKVVLSARCKSKAILEPKTCECLKKQKKQQIFTSHFTWDAPFEKEKKMSKNFFIKLPKPKKYFHLHWKRTKMSRSQVYFPQEDIKIWFSAAVFTLPSPDIQFTGGRRLCLISIKKWEKKIETTTHLKQLNIKGIG